LAHRLDPEPHLEEAMLRYEIALRLHVVGLAWARSPYAYQAVGSTLVLDAKAYARVRGFPRRQAGEDFYLLNKMAKQGQMLRLGGSAIQLAGRLSHRVPFGTGAALTQQVKDSEVIRPHGAYAPALYPAVALALRALDELAEPALSLSPEGALKRLDDGLSESLSPALRLATVNALHHAVKWEKLQRVLEPLDNTRLRRRQIHTLVDAFVTLKMVHHLRDAGWPNLPVEDAAQQMADGLDVARPDPRDLRGILTVAKAWEKSTAMAGPIGWPGD
jgi:hypothetical protein